MRIRGLILPSLAVLFALGMGIALGAGPLHSVDAPTPTGPPVSRPTPNAGFPEQVVSAAATTLYAQGLAGRSVAVVSLPGASVITVEALKHQVVLAGGTVASTTTIGASLTSPGNRAMVETLSADLAAQFPEIADVAAPTYLKMGQLIGAAIATTEAPPPAATEPSGGVLPSGSASTSADSSAPASPRPASAQATRTTVTTASPTATPATVPATTPEATPTVAPTTAPTSTTSQGPDPVVAAIRRSVVAARMTSDIDAAEPLAPMVLVVTGRRIDPPIVTGLVGGIAAKAHNVVVAGRTRNADLASLRTGRVPVVTIDGDESTAGRVAAVLALVKQLTSGSFGASGIDGPLPIG